jgi:N4-gp56 family major capsid protein
VATGTTGLTQTGDITPEIIARRCLSDSIKLSFWGRMVGAAGSGAPLEIHTDLEGGPGSILDLPVSAALTAAGVSETSTLEGNEEQLDFSVIRAVPSLRRHAVRVERLSQQRSMPDVLAEARKALSVWGANKLDALRWASFVSSTLPSPISSDLYAPNELFANTTAADVDDLVAADDMTVDFIRRIKLQLIAQDCQPLVLGGVECYAMVLSPFQTYALRNDSTLMSMLVDASPRGVESPLLSGSIGKLDGVVLFEHKSVPVATNANGVPTSVGTAIAFGAAAMVEALGERPTFTADQWDYAGQIGVGFQFSQHARRSLERQSLLCYSSAVDPSA